MFSHTLVVLLVVSPCLHALRLSAAPKCCAAGDTMTLQALLSTLKPLGPMRTIAVLPGASAILEATSESADWALKVLRRPARHQPLATAAVHGPTCNLLPRRSR